MKFKKIYLEITNVCNLSCDFCIKNSRLRNIMDINFFSAVLDKLNGFIGKTCIHPSQLKYVQESNIVTYEQYKDATAILGMADGLIGVKKGYNNNKMNEVKTHSTWAKKIIGLAEVYGVLAEEKPDLINDRRENEDTGVVIEK